MAGMVLLIFQNNSFARENKNNLPRILEKINCMTYNIGIDRTDIRQVASWQNRPRCIVMARQKKRQNDKYNKLSKILFVTLKESKFKFSYFQFSCYSENH